MLKQRLATFISYLTHPLWLPSVAIALALDKAYCYNILPFSLASNTNIPYYAYLIYVISSSVFLPLIVFRYLLKRGKINSLQMKTSQERLVPSFVLLLVYILNSLLFLTLRKQALLAFVFISASYVTIVNLIVIIAFKFKISLHTSSIAAFTVACAILYHAQHISALALISVTILSIVVGFARWQLKAHSLSQIIAGYLLGFSTLLLYQFH